MIDQVNATQHELWGEGGGRKLVALEVNLNGWLTLNPGKETVTTLSECSAVQKTDSPELEFHC